MIFNKKIKLGMFFLIGILLIFSVSAYSTSNPNYGNFNSFFGGDGSWRADRSMCEAGQDFIIQIAPFGCTPAVVRSDLLEEQNVPVFCQIAATKINPLIEVEAIEHITFTGDYPKEVSGIGFYPAKAALGVRGNLNSPILNNIGYAVIVLKKQKNASAMPDFVIGNLTAKIRYDIQNAFGVGKASFYLPELSDDAWEKEKIQYSFWDGKGYVRAEGVDEDGATISIYTDDGKLSSVNLEKGETSKKIYMPGFDCLAGMQVKLEGFENPDTRAKLKINADVVEVADGEKFLENKCEIDGIDNSGLVQKVWGHCETDEKRGEKFDLRINPRVELSIEGKIDEYGVGDWLYSSANGDKSVYVAYIGETPGEVSGLGKVPFVILLERPYKVDKLSDSDIRMVQSQINFIYSGQETGSGFLNMLSKGLSAFKAGMIEALNKIGKGINLHPLFLGYEGKEIFGKEVNFIKFAGPQEKELDEKSKEYYDKAMTDYNQIIESFASEKHPLYTEEQKLTLGEEALYKQITLAEKMEQKKTMIELCEEFKTKYPKSKYYEKLYKVGEGLCDNNLKLSSSDSSTTSVSINGVLKEISFEGIYEPSFSDYGARIIIKSPDGIEVKDLTKNKIIFLKEIVDPETKKITTIETIQLLSVDEDSIKLQVNLVPANLDELAKKIFISNIETLKKGVSDTFGSRDYVFELTDINLKKSARVSIIPDIDNAGTEADFGFKIGIEKRAIELSPAEIKKKIAELNKTIDKWQGISENLGKMVKGFKAGCLGVGAMLTVKNFFTNVGGKAIARQNVMRGGGGWYEICTNALNDGNINGRTVNYKSINECLTKEADNINEDVDSWYDVMKEQNAQLKTLEEGITETKFLSEKYVDDDKFMKEYTDQVNGVLNGLGDKVVNPDNSAGSIDIADIKTALSYDAWKNQGYYDKEQLRNIELYTLMLEKEPDNERIKKLLYSELKDVQVASNNYAERVSIQTKIKDEGLNLGISSYGDEKAITGTYSGGTITSKQIPGANLVDIKDGKVINYPAEIITYGTGKYIVLFEQTKGSEYVVEKVYEYKGIENKIIQVEEDKTDVIGGKFKTFKKYDSSSYENKFKNHKLKYYETEPYKGMPAIVPFDLKNGWYAATKQTLPVFGGIRPQDDSGRITSFYLCNVMENGMEEFKSGLGDDECQMINLGTGQPYYSFSGLSESVAKRLVNCAIGAMEDASRAYKNKVKNVRISTGCGSFDLSVGTPAIDIPDMQCQDFMSPKDCKLLFNACDPVVCPSSRCDLGGAYPVKDVIQSGIVGSIALCLPNYREGIYVPVCLSGIKAGIDSLLSVYTAYGDCLQNSLDTGEMVGICDEIYSINLCEFFWRQAIPLAEITIPKLVELFMGQNVHGGGEYLGVQSAWENAQKSVTYFTQYYAANSYKAFKARTTEEVGGEVCNNFVSGVYPEGGNFLDALTEPDSPFQFMGRFDEIPFTTATVPPISQYKVWYHIYAGKDSRAYFQVYLKAGSESSFYQDTTYRRVVASGFIPVGGYADEAVDFTAPSGYKKLCIVVNGQESCDFKEVTSSFGLNYVKDAYLTNQAEEIDVKTETECVAGTASAYSLLSPNLQEGAEEVINPAIYNRGIIRICATSNPGKGTDGLAGMNGSRWVDVGYCGDKGLRCWLDTDSVEEVIKHKGWEADVLQKTNENYQDILQNTEDYLSPEEFEKEVKEIETKEDLTSDEKIEKINEIIDKVFLYSEKGYLLLLRGNAYGEIADVAYKDYLKKRLADRLAAEQAAANKVTPSSGGTSTVQKPVETINIKNGEYEKRYKLYESTFEDYVKINLPNGWEKNDFKALLCAIATQESSMGDNGVRLFMGYNPDSGPYGVTKQVLGASTVLKEAFEKDNTLYLNCYYLNFGIDKIKCVLGIYGPEKEKGYADTVYGYYLQWKDYFNSN